MVSHPVTMVATRRLRPSKRNARTHSKKQKRQLADVILRFGWTTPIVVDENLEILCGHLRWETACELGIKEVSAIVLAGLRDAEKRAFALADNKIAANANWDRGVLAAEFAELRPLLADCNLELEITGFETPEIDALAVDFTDPEREPSDEIPALAATSPTTQPGDLWKLGPHRLLCTDARDESAFRQLMGTERASMAFVDPPYNLKISKAVGRGRTKHREFLSASGEMCGSEFVDFTKTWMKFAAQYSENGSIHFSCIDWRHLADVLAAGKGVYSELKNIVVWVKTNAGQGSFYRSKHEFIAVFKNGDAPHQNNIELGKHGRNRSNVWSYAGANTFRAGRMDDLSAHPTVKPTLLVADAIRDCSRRGEIVLDCFMGSGTTILAAERIGRRAYGMEIDALYVDLAIQRWQSFTGRDATLAATGQTFDEVMGQGRDLNRKSLGSR
jgi:DNA modification methylase